MFCVMEDVMIEQRSFSRIVKEMRETAVKNGSSQHMTRRGEVVGKRLGKQVRWFVDGKRVTVERLKFYI